MLNIVIIIISCYIFSNVLDPPGAPIIIDHSSGNPIPSGNVHKISCLSTGGNPLASVAWFKNDKKVQCDIKLI